MSQTLKNKTDNRLVKLLNLLVTARKDLPESFVKAAGILRSKKQRQDLERHVKKMRAEWW